VLVAMPLRAATGVSLDGGSGVLGWGHGVLLLLYLQALQVAARALGWSWSTVAAAGLASLLPLGTLVFEWIRLRPEDRASAR
jgi:integral membrane protein